MKNPYVLPVCFAASFHGALLFGFTKHPTVKPVVKEDRFVWECSLTVPEDPPEVVLPEFSESASKPEPAPPHPSLPEPLSVPTDTVFKIDPPPVTRVTSSDIRNSFERTIGASTGPGVGPWTDGVIPREMLDNSPRTRFQASPVYPFDAKQHGMTGEVYVEFLVDEAGNVRDPQVVRSSNPIFNDATLRAVAKWRFEPGRRGGRVVRFRMTAPVVFTLND